MAVMHACVHTHESVNKMKSFSLIQITIEDDVTLSKNEITQDRDSTVSKNWSLEDMLNNSTDSNKKMQTVRNSMVLVSNPVPSVNKLCKRKGNHL